MDNAAPLKQSEAEAQLAKGYREERNAFRAACSFAGGLILFIIARGICIFFHKRRLRQMALSGVPLGEILDEMNEFPLWAYFLGGLLVVSLVGLLLSLALWLRAIHDRRRIAAKYFPTTSN